jgi:hypothetical protein
MKMSEAGSVFHVEDKYTVELSPENYLILVFGVEIGTAGMHFSHPNCVASKPVVHEFKHYHKDGGKSWTAKPGIDFYFVVPKTQIEMIQEKGHSYVPIEVNGLKCRLNVSGGTAPGGGWSDWVRRIAHTHCGATLKQLKTVAEVSLSPVACQEQGITLDLKPMDDNKWFLELIAPKMIELVKGNKVVANDKTTMAGTIFTIECQTQGIGRARQSYSAYSRFNNLFRIKFSQIDWGKTIEANHFNLVIPPFLNMIKAA